MTTDEPIGLQFRSREALTESIDSDPSSYDAWEELINLEAWEGNVDTAVSALLRAVDAVSDRDRLWQMVDEFSWVYGIGREPIIVLYERWKIDTHQSASTSIFFAKQFKEFDLLEFSNECISRAEREVHTAQDCVWLAEYMRENGEAPRALAVLQRGIVAHPRDATIWDCLADTHRLGKSARELAEASYQSFKQCRLDGVTEKADVAWASFGWMLDTVGNYFSAEEAYRQAMEIDPRYSWPIGKLSGLLRRRFGRYHEAESLAQRCVEIDPDDAWSWFNLGFLHHHHLNRFGDAKAAYSRAIELKPDYVKVWENLVALMAFETDTPAETQETFDKLFELSGISAFAYNQYGIFLREMTDRYDESEKALLHAIDMEPAEWSHRLALAVLYEKRMLRFGDARKRLLEAKERGAPVDNIDYRLALIAQRRRPLKVIK
ncbi:tetratricopeptide repeat protein [Mesorhizobium japonicum]|uniref:Mll1835 protein n=1 Tax=Mesorhizobium japonicum (strain LMG 29417 / CECT 9101 / MAFF 303099) TaxID=266835 RepID=Q98JQ3_RHILO|nr:tetratricopeptide repeat protein [Mesorhizobium japonicum]BAB49112.1 mll1835 [Mesorhizobium japonicum MAFF 303099]